MKHFKLASAAAFVLSVAAAGVAQADSGIVRFVGTVTDETCVIGPGVGAVGAPGDITVPLTPVSATDLATNGATAGRKTFELVFSNGEGGGCGSQTITQAQFQYVARSQAVDAGTGNLRNNILPSQGGAENVQIQLLQPNGGAAIDLRAHTADVVPLQEDAVSRLAYDVQYIAPTGNASAGGVETFVQYEATYN
jgi:major type 1 subunit fimbrin (pilin)